MSAYIMLHKPIDIKSIGVSEDSYYYLWEDYKEHEVINFTYLDSLLTHKNKLNALRDINWQIVEGEKVTPVEECLYMQGWFFKKSLLNRKEPFYFTRSKDNMIKFLYKYIKGKKADIIHALEDAWEDGMIFEFAY